MLKDMAGTTGLEPAASAVTGQRSNQLNYVPTRQINEMRNRQCLYGFARFAYRAPIAFGCLRERLPGATVYNPPANFCAELFGAGNARASRHGAEQGGTSLNHSNSFPSNAKGFDVSSHSDYTGYATANTPATIRDPDRWQPSTRIATANHSLRFSTCLCLTTLLPPCPATGGRRAKRTPPQTWHFEPFRTIVIPNEGFSQVPQQDSAGRSRK